MKLWKFRKRKLKEFAVPTSGGWIEHSYLFIALRKHRSLKVETSARQAKLRLIRDLSLERSDGS